MKARDLLFIALLLVTGFLVYGRSRASGELRSLRLAVDASRAGPAERGRGDTATLPVLPRRAPTLDSPAPAVVPSTPTPPGERAPLSMSDHIAHVETTFEQQSEGGSWAKEAAVRLEQGLSRIAKGSHDLGQVECKSSLCQAQYAGNDPSKCEEFAQGAVHQTPPYFWEGPYTVKINPASAGKGCSVSMMFGREGTDLPSID
jgi:hypothetical protein